MLRMRATTAQKQLYSESSKIPGRFWKVRKVLASRANMEPLMDNEEASEALQVASGVIQVALKVMEQNIFKLK